jgi:transglutaminase-like putative cysteine protease
MSRLHSLLVSLATLAPVAAAATADREIIRDTDRFEFIYRVRLPEIEKPGRLWLPLARSDAFQKVEMKNVAAPTHWQRVNDRDHGNTLLVMTVEPAHSGELIEIHYVVQRHEKTAHPSLDPNPLRHLRPERLVPINQTFNTIAAELTRDKSTATERGRALYDHVLQRMKYDKSGDGWGRGDAVYACDARTGNCTDFHAYFIALARAAGIPARFAIGYTIPADRNEGDIGGYHCWAEFLADAKWVPVDISEASRHPELAEYYFGHHPANRFEFTVGRDLIVEPPPASGPINFLVYPILEVDGQQLKTQNEFRFRRLPPQPPP